MPFTLSQNDDWLFWSPGLDDDERAALVSAAVARGGNRIEVTEAVRAATSEALEHDGAAVAGLWLPDAHERRVLGALQGRILHAERAKDKDARRFLKSVRRAPLIAGLAVVDYSASDAEVDAGAVVVQHLATHAGDSAPAMHTWRASVFPTHGDEIYLLEFSTIVLSLLDEFEGSLADVVNNMAASDS